MKIHGFRDMYLKELQELQSVETQVKDTFPRLQALAADDGLKQAIGKHLDTTRSQRDRLDAILAEHDVNPDRHTDQSMTALIAESEKWVQMLDNPDVRDAGLIASAQKIAHYQIAAYGTVACWAKHLDLDTDLAVLLDILEQDKAFDADLSRLAKQKVNPDALQ
ncbi:DUF892 family protein [Loktanella sp. SALINAS62]|uniref:YciE/YciF ferroxidase family protein n=1 Tax=Loktanella sp. SALINAS62 TaxID=2706124 RepID=UPI001B8AA1F8|nr:DUF892 family protein [Loktanella sp. SALINAS62]MBS1302621.1 ferritin-like domain-containing protein [Loktanella sp. SALINAS62]